MESCERGATRSFAYVGDKSKLYSTKTARAQKTTKCGYNYDLRCPPIKIKELGNF